MVLLRLQEQFYRMTTRPTMFCGPEFWVIKKKYLKNKHDRNENAMMTV